MTQLDIFTPAETPADLHVFTFPETGDEFQAVRIDGSLWVVAAPLARGLAHRDAADMIRNLDADEKGTHSVRTPGGDQVVSVISEPGLYRVMANRRVGAIKDPTLRAKIERFQRWVFHEVIPAAARSEFDANKPRHEIPQSFADALQLAADQARQIEQQGQQIAELEPKAEQADHFRKADGLAAVASFCNDLQLWARENHGVRLLHEEIRDFLGDIGLIIRSDSLRKNEPYGEAIKNGYVRPKHTKYGTNTRGDVEATSARLTQKGWGYAWDRAVKRIAGRGSLAPITAVAIPTQSLPSERS